MTTDPAACAQAGRRVLVPYVADAGGPPAARSRTVA